MRFSNHKLADSGRFLRRSFLFACLASLLLGSSSRAGTDVLTFSQAFPTDVATLTNGGSGTSTLSSAGNADGSGVSIPVIATTFMGAAVTIPMFETFVGVHSVGPAGNLGGVGGTDYQQFTGTVEFTSAAGGAGANYLTATFSSMTLNVNLISGGDTGASATLSTAQPPASLVMTSDFAMLGPPNSFSLSFSNLSPALTIQNGSLGVIGTPSTAQNTGDASATIVPEPSTLAIAGLGALGLIGYGLRRRKALGA